MTVPKPCTAGRSAAYVAGLNAAGSSIAIEDLAAHRALVLPPLGAAFRDLHVSVVPPNSQGFVLLEILALLERLRARRRPPRSRGRRDRLVFAAAPGTATGISRTPIT
jgi:gamma-glutamyltranspeptidase